MKATRRRGQGSKRSVASAAEGRGARRRVGAAHQEANDEVFSANNKAWVSLRPLDVSRVKMAAVRDLRAAAAGQDRGEAPLGSRPAPDPAVNHKHPESFVTGGGIIYFYLIIFFF